MTCQAHFCLPLLHLPHPGLVCVHSGLSLSTSRAHRLVYPQQVCFITVPAFPHLLLASEGFSSPRESAPPRGTREAGLAAAWAAGLAAAWAAGSASTGPG